MKALIKINGRPINPFSIRHIGIGGAQGRRKKDDFGRKLYHTMASKLNTSRPWYKSMFARFYKTTPYRHPYVYIEISNKWYDNIEIQCTNFEECRILKKKLIEEWDDAIAKFHGSNINKDNIDVG